MYLQLFPCTSSLVPSKYTILTKCLHHNLQAVIQNVTKCSNQYKTAIMSFICTCAFVCVVYIHCVLADLLLCIMCVNEPLSSTWSDLLSNDLPDSEWTPHVIIQLIVFRIQCSRFISCKPTCALWEFEWNDLYQSPWWYTSTEWGFL